MLSPTDHISTLMAAVSDHPCSGPTPVTCPAMGTADATIASPSAGMTSDTQLRPGSGSGLEGAADASGPANSTPPSVATTAGSTGSGPGEPNAATLTATTITTIQAASQAADRPEPRRASPPLSSMISGVNGSIR